MTVTLTRVTDINVEITCIGCGRAATRPICPDCDEGLRGFLASAETQVPMGKSFKVEELSTVDYDDRVTDADLVFNADSSPIRRKR